MLHGAYNIQNYHEKEELKEMCDLVENHFDTCDDNEKFTMLPEPVMIRWWLVGLCACTLKNI